MPLNELRISAMLQAAVIALVLGFVLRNAAAASSTWPYFLGGYGFLAATVPWLAGVDKSDFSLRFSLVLGLLFALPLCVAAYWLSLSPYRVLTIGCLALLTLWGVHFLASLVVWLRGDRHGTL